MQGVGALYVRRRPRVRVEPIQNGGGQERGLRLLAVAGHMMGSCTLVHRSGTVPTPLVVGLGAACELSGQEMEYDHSHVSRLSEILIQVGNPSHVQMSSCEPRRA